MNFRRYAKHPCVFAAKLRRALVSYVKGGLRYADIFGREQVFGLFKADLFLKSDGAWRGYDLEVMIERRLAHIASARPLSYLVFS